MDRRFFLKSTVAASPLLCIPTSRIYAMDPVTLSIVLGLIGASGVVLSAKLASDRAAEAQVQVARMQFDLERMRQAFEIRRIKYQMNGIPISEEFAFDGQNFGSAILQSNIDGIGTEFGVNGRLASRRSHFGGDFTAVEAARFARGVGRGEPMPVPVDRYYTPFSPDEAREVQHVLTPGQSLIAKRAYSSSRRPTKDGWDLETILIANADNTVGAQVVPRG